MQFKKISLSLTLFGHSKSDKSSEVYLVLADGETIGDMLQENYGGSFHIEFEEIEMEDTELIISQGASLHIAKALLNSVEL